MIKAHLKAAFLRCTQDWYPQCLFPRLWLHRLLYTIFIEKLQSILQNPPQHQKNNTTSNTDAPDADAPNAADYDASDAPDYDDDDTAYPKSIPLSLKNCIRNSKISPNTKKQ